MKRMILGATIATVATVALAGPAMAEAKTDQVSVQVDHQLGTVPRQAVGINDPLWDEHQTDPQVPGLLRKAGVRMRSFNGGPLSDVYRWRTNTADPDPIIENVGVKPAAGNDFDSFMARARKTGAEAMVHVNYGSRVDDGPQEAADWVRHANVEKHDNVKYWEIGEEVYGNGFYPIAPQGAWEPDHHADKSPQAYGKAVLEYVKAMKAVDPSIKIGVGVLGFGKPGQDWDSDVLSVVGKDIDFIDMHAYPEFAVSTDDYLLHSADHLPGLMASLRAKLAANGGEKAEVVVGEMNNNGVVPGQQSVGVVDAMYLADAMPTWIEQGASSVNWFATHNSPTLVRDASGKAIGYGDYGMLSTGECKEGFCEPKANTPFPTYYGMQLAAKVLRPGANLLATTSSDQRNVTAHASQRADGSITVLLINKDASNAHQVNLSVPGFRMGCEVESYGQGDKSVQHRRQQADAPLVLAPYSLTEVVLHK
ncbi:hypothetical protein F0L68_36900 [Solihabitans fulvus]|uniref:Uncharacterized protein n=1 Tax=Solihabitans fulvus TaxID=1892852 RepID=A0A5B2WN62_9PSEU|nr:hypothetical protein [Solihabitans fulvus]KAA2252132.1 hypothetical protein F0L68_36900 [Solihabitans fulvus]